jgi:predicted AlkP superfamily pyrophosphatase or phosphodiesterase
MNLTSQAAVLTGVCPAATDFGNNFFSIPINNDIQKQFAILGKATNIPSQTCLSNTSIIQP